MMDCNLSPIKKVIHLTSVHPYNDVRIFCKELVSLKQNGFSVTLIVPAAGDIRDDLSNIEIISVGIPRNRLLRATLTAWRIYRIAEKNKAAIYHFHDPELIWVGLLLKAHGLKVIYDVHENVSAQILDKEWLPRRMRKFISYFFAKFEIWSAKYFDYVIVATPSIKKYFTEFNISQCIDINNYPFLVEYNFCVSNLEKIDNQICYVGCISEIRGIKQMIFVLELISDAQLALAGNFSDAVLRKDCCVLSGWERVIERGIVDRKSAITLMKQSIAGLVLFHPVANHIEAQPNKFFEYMAAGIPVIASDFPLWRSIIVGNNCGICVNPLDIYAIADAIKYIIDHPEEAKIMGNNGRRLVLEKFNWENEVKKLLDVYKEVLACE
jgi:glycosyltransferase involved in cell wall biosynthesis